MRRPITVLATSAALTLALSLIAWFLGSSNPSTPGGYVGYVTQGAVFGRRHFIATQVGPTSAGMTWMATVQNVSVTPYTYDEKFDRADGTAVLSKDGMQIAFAVHVTFRIRPDAVRDFVEHYTTSQGDDKPDGLVHDAYDNFLRSRVQTYARDAVQRYPWQQLTSEIDVIGKDVSERVLALTAGTAFDVQSVVVGNIQFPQSVADAVAEAMAAGQVFQRKQMEVQQATADAAKRVAEAKGIADAMALVSGKLTPQYLQYEAIKSQEAIVNGPSHSTIYIPVGPMGVPLVGTFPADQGGSTRPAQ